MTKIADAYLSLTKKKIPMHFPKSQRTNFDRLLMLIKIRTDYATKQYITRVYEEDGYIVLSLRHTFNEKPPSESNAV